MSGSMTLEPPRGLPQSTIEEILSCQSLPSLPAIAPRVWTLARRWIWRAAG